MPPSYKELLFNSSMLLKTSEIKAKIKTFTCLLPHKAEVAEFSITKVVLFSTAEVKEWSSTKVVAKAVPDGKVGDEDQHDY